MAFTGLLVLAGLEAASAGVPAIRRLSGPILLMAVVVLVVGLLRASAIVGRAREATWRDAFGAFWLGLALSWPSPRRRLGPSGPASPPFSGHQGPRASSPGGTASAATSSRSGLAAVCLAVAALAIGQAHVEPVVVGLLLLLQGSAYAAALAISVAAIRADLPEDLGRRRPHDWMSSWLDLRPGRRSGLVPGLAAGAVGALVVLASPVGGPDVTGLLVAISARESAVTSDSGPASTSSTTSDASTATRTSGTDLLTSSSASTQGPTAGRPTTTPAPEASSPAPVTTDPVVVTARPTASPTAAPPTTSTASPTTHRGTGRPTPKPTRTHRP